MVTPQRTTRDVVGNSCVDLFTLLHHVELLRVEVLCRAFQACSSALAVEGTRHGGDNTCRVRLPLNVGLESQILLPDFLIDKGAVEEGLIGSIVVVDLDGIASTRHPEVP